MQTQTEKPRIVLPRGYRHARLIELADVLAEIETFAHLIRMASRALAGDESDAIASGAIEVVSRIADAREMIGEIRKAA